MARAQITAPQFFVRASVSAQQLAFEMEKGKFKYEGYKGKKLLSEVVYGQVSVPC